MSHATKLLRRALVRYEEAGLIEPNEPIELDSVTDDVGSNPAASASVTESEYIVGAAHGALSAERVATNTTSITWDLATAGQAKAKRAALTGDVTADADGNATTIANNAVTFAKMQDAAGNTVVARADAASGDLSAVALGTSELFGRDSSGNVAPITLGANLTMTGTSLAAAAGGLTEQDKIDLAWNKKFFSDAGLLPVTERIAASLATFPTETGYGVGSAANFVKETGLVRLLSGPVTAYYDLGALRGEVLVVANGMQHGGGVQMCIYLSSAVPSAEFMDGYYFFQETTASAGFHLSKRVGGSFTHFTVAPNFTINVQRPQGMALYYKDSTDTLKAFLKHEGNWFLIDSRTAETDHTTVRYVSLEWTTTSTGRITLPFVAYSN